MTRDSLFFSWLAVIVAVAGYFATGGDPRLYTFQQWMQAIVAIGGIIAGKLGSSPLPSQHEQLLNDLQPKDRS